MARCTYLGWRTLDGRYAVAVLHGSVMTPLSAKANATTASWSCPGPGAQAVGRVILVDVLGSLGEWEDLLELFVGEIVTALPEPEFELPAASVLAWANQRRLNRNATTTAALPPLIRRSGNDASNGSPFVSCRYSED
ncbi:MAG: hypothetical protein ACRDV9_15235 [Acidimicrobiia bacterium]